MIVQSFQFTGGLLKERATPHPLDSAGVFARENSEMPETGSDARLVYRRIHQTLKGDGAPQRNLASFVTTRMDEHAERLVIESASKNLINSAEYPQTEAIHQRVIRMIAGLYHAELPADEETGFIGTTTVGSSEALMLALLAHKCNWKNRRRNPSASSSASFKDRPYLVIGSHTHACFAKFARYFDVGVKWIPLNPGQYAITAEDVKTALETRIADDAQVMEECGFTTEEAGDRKFGELVMAVGLVAGTTYTGALDDVEGVDRVLTEGGWEIPIHVDAASGGFVLPFTQPDLKWDFRLTRVQSINVSNHKYGLVYPGLGTLVFRNGAIVPEELLVDVSYLSGEMRNFGLNFSRASNGVVAQYYNFLQMGRAGYRRVIRECLETAQYLANALESLPALQPYFEIVSDTKQMPVVAFRLKGRATGASARLTLANLGETLKGKGWIAPVYHLPANLEEIEVMRVVVKPEFARAQARAFLNDLVSAVRELTAESHKRTTGSLVDALRACYTAASAPSQAEATC